jgi:predicted transcriptional regulator
MKYRSRADIAATILEIAQGGVLKTRIMYSAFLSYPQLKEYLEFLKENGLLGYIPEKKVYRTTEKGSRFLNSYQELHHMLYPKDSKVLKERSKLLS